LVNSVEPGSPADKAGIEVSDVILKFDGKAINSADDLVRFVGGTKPGTKASIEVWRNKATRQLISFSSPSGRRQSKKRQTSREIATRLACGEAAMWTRSCWTSSLLKDRPL
jgi:serine protease Do